MLSVFARAWRHWQFFWPFRRSPSFPPRSPSPIPTARLPRCSATASCWNSSGSGARPWPTTRTPSASTRRTPSLQQRFDAARLHYDLQRRYADRSFRESVSRLSIERALDLYGQVLLKIESHYVECRDGKTCWIGAPPTSERGPGRSRPSSTATCRRAIRLASTPSAANCGD